MHRQLEEDDMTPASRLRRLMQFTSFPNCPICEEIPIATEAAAITAAARISQHWPNDACDHHFETRP
jgi:hypothetical protein